MKMNRSVCVLILLSAVPAMTSANTVAIGDPFPGGIRYHLSFWFDQPGVLTAKTGDALPLIGVASDRQDFGGDGLVDEVAVKAWRLPLSPSGVAPGDYGWSLNSRWSIVDLNGLKAQGYNFAQVSVTLQADPTVPEGNGEHLHDLIPALTAWQGIETTVTQGPPSNIWYPNGYSSTNWADWWATDLKQSALAGKVWWAADDSANPVHSVTLTLPWLPLNGSSDFLTLVFGGNRYDHPTQFNFANFKTTVAVQAAVPVPGAGGLLASILAGWVIGSWRRSSQDNPISTSGVEQ